MAWYFYILIIVGIVLVFFLIKKLTKPRFKKVEKYLKPKSVEVKKEPVKSEMKIQEPIGLNFDAKFIADEDNYIPKEDKEDSYEPFDFGRHTRMKKQKTILQQIRELSPELKALIFDRGLAKKDYEFMSKKDWIRIPFNEVKRVQFFWWN